MAPRKTKKAKKKAVKRKTGPRTRTRRASSSSASPAYHPLPMMPAQQSHSSRAWIWILLLIMIVVAVVFLMNGAGKTTTAAAKASGSDGWVQNSDGSINWVTVVVGVVVGSIVVAAIGGLGFSDHRGVTIGGKKYGGNQYGKKGALRAFGLGQDAYQGGRNKFRDWRSRRSGDGKATKPAGAIEDV